MWFSAVLEPGLVGSKSLMSTMCAWDAADEQDVGAGFLWDGKSLY